MDRPTRRQLLRAVGTGTVIGAAGCMGSSPVDPSPSPDATGTPTGTTSTETPVETVALESLTEGLRAPVSIAFTPEGQRYILEQEGLVVRHGDDGLADEPALDLRDSVTAGGERGLLGIALHPNYAENRRLFLRYSAPRRSGTPEDYSHTFVLAEFEADETNDIQRDSERTVLEIPQPQGNHNAGDLAFGPDGLLYVAVGDGGSGGDQGDGHVDDWYDAVPGGNGQDVTENLLGSLLRIDVDDTDDDRAYAIPDDNPLVDGDGLDEHYAWGLRNPWRLAFDGEDLIVADVGQNRYEEVNLVEAGGNYGWNVKEGRHCYETADCPDETPAEVRGGEPLLDPVIEYPHDGDPIGGISVIGGQIYRGSAVPGLDGRYVFGDLDAGGELFVATRSGDAEWPTQALPVAEEDAGKLGQLFSFGRDSDGEVYVLGIGERGGGVHRLVSA